MGAYSRQSGAWDESSFVTRDGAEWKDPQSSGWVRDGGAWVQFTPIAGASDLLVPTNLLAVPGDIDATCSWTNPTPTGVTPTQVQFRIPEITTVWTELDYPATSIAVAFLTAGVDYQFQVRYITRSETDGTIELTGTTATKFFTTTALDGPGTPAADPGGTGGDSTVYWGDIGSGCTWEYIVQTADTPAAGAITWSDTATTGSFLGDVGELSINFATEGLACGALARFKYRSNCGGALSDYEYGDPFPIACDWDVTCSGVPNSTQLNTGLYIDANCLFAFPEACGTIIRDTIDPTIQLGRLPGFGSIQTVVGPHTVFGLTTNGTLGVPTLAGQFGSMALLTDADDTTWAIRVHLEEVPGGSGGGSGTAPASFPLVRFGRNVAISAVFSTTTTYLIRCSWIDATGTFQSLTSSTSFALDTMHNVVVTMDADGDKILYVNGEVEDTNADTTAPGFSSFGIGQDVAVYTNEFGRFRAVCAWDRALSAVEVGELEAPPYPFYVDENAELITAISTSFTHTLPSGIQAGDLIMVLWRPNDTSLLKTFGATPAGWTAGAQSIATKLYYKIADGTETDMSLTWTGTSSNTGANQGHVHSLLYRNVDPTDPFMYEPSVIAASGSSTFWDSPGADPATSDSTSGSPTNLDNWTTFMEGSSFVGVVSSPAALTLSASTTYQPNVTERTQTLGSRDVRSWSHDGITENSGLYNDQSARWTQASDYNDGFAALLRAPRTTEWLAKTHVAYRHTTRLDTAFDSALAVVGDVAHLDGMLAMVCVASGSATLTSQYVDTTAGVNTWMTPLNGNHIYYGTWAAAGRQARAASLGSPIVTTFIIANANTSDPCSVNMTRSYNTQTFGAPAYFWTRTDQLIIGHFRTSTLDASFWTYGASDLMSVEHRDWQRNTSAGNQSAQVVYGRGTTDGYGFLPELTPNDGSGNNLAWLGINHSSESSPSLATPTIVGSPTVQTRTGTSGTFTITKPTGTQVGEILVMFVHLQIGGEIQSANPPDGFEPIDQQQSGGSGGGVYEIWMKVVDGTEPASWAPAVNGAGAIIMQRVTGILPMRGHPFWLDSGTIANPQPFATPELYRAGIVLRSGAYQDGTARVVAVSVGTDIVADLDAPPLSTSTTHWNVKGEVIGTSTPGAANYTLTPFPGAPSTARGSVYHLAAGPA